MADSVGRGMSHLTRRTPRSCPWPVRGLEPKPRWSPPVLTPGGGPPGCGSPARPRWVGRSRSRLGCTRLGSPRCFGKCGGHGASPSPPSSSRRARSSSCVERARRRASMSAAGSPTSRRRSGTVSRRRSPGSTSGDLVPLAARTTRARPASGAPSSRTRRCGRARSGCSRRTRRGAPPSTTCSSPGRARGARPRARARARRGARSSEVPLGLDPDVDVDALRARRLRVAAQPVLGEHVAHDQRGAAHRVPADARRRVEVHAQLVGMVEVAAARRPRVEVDHAEVDRPHEVRRVVGDELLGGAAGRERDRRRLQPLRHVLRHALLPDRLLHDPVDEALHHGRALAHVDRARRRRPRGSTRRGRASSSRAAGSRPCPGSRAGPRGPPPRSS